MTSLEPQSIYFTIDSAILRELGERLVGKPHIALAELIKNAYDADATKVTITFGDDHIEILDNGHGMTYEEFVRFWMRIGSPHKRDDQTSRLFNRPLTGSKGVGRLAAQFLARKLEITTSSMNNDSVSLCATVDWEEAIQAEDLTRAKAQLKKPESFSDQTTHGTRIVLHDLNQTWDVKAIESLAKEIWWLRQPFTRSNLDDPQAFQVEFIGRDQNEKETFEKQMNAILAIWTARIDGKLTGEVNAQGHAKAEVIVRFDDEKKKKATYFIENCLLKQASFQIRIYNLVYRQPHGIGVKDAREYMRQYGGVHVYDRGFHLPYYGPTLDWLGIEQDHAQREWTSKLLPKEIQVERGQNDLPTNSRILGVVHVDTSFEESIIGESLRRKGGYLQIQLTRDRLVQNEAYDNLVRLVRWSLDFYANEYRRRQLAIEPQNAEIEFAEKKFEELETVLERHKESLEPEIFQDLSSASNQASQAAQEKIKRLERQTNLLGSLASVGISTLAFQHELGGMTAQLDDIVKNLRSIDKTEKGKIELQQTVEQLDIWVQRFRATRSLFTHMLERDNREERIRPNAAAIIDRIYLNLGVLARGVKCDVSRVDRRLLLPIGTFAEWSSVFQNVFLNALNAMLDVPREDRRIEIVSFQNGLQNSIRVQDTGVGVDLQKAETYFEAFERDLEISEERRALGVGGSGLGLTIVRSIAENMNCSVKFVEPELGFSTAFELSWEEVNAKK